MADPSNSPITSSTLSEAASKDLVERYGVPLAAEHIVADAESAVAAAAEIGGAVAVKLNGDTIAHKTERGLVRLSLADEAAVRSAAEELLAAARPEDGDVSLLVAPMVSGAREFIVGMIRDPQFGPMVMLGVGGVLAEAIADVAFRPAPVDEVTAQEQINSLTMSDLLGEFRGEAAVDRKLLLDTLVGLGKLAEEHPEVISVDINPLIIDRSGRPVAVDALVEVAETLDHITSSTSRPSPSDDHFRALFEPGGVVVTGASSHPGKFGFVALHNLLTAGYSGNVFATNRSGEEVLGIQTISDVAEMPDGVADLMFVCTPASANLQLLEDAAQRGVKAAFLTSAGYGEAGEEGREAEAELVATADRLGILLAGPNGQGVVSTPASLCAQIVAPYPPAGGIGVASQSGNFVSSFLNLSRSTGVGVSRAVSAGN
ncbi:MAG: acetate--CoA ligase family protein, partial [Ilumatobacteraceae bacterium]